MAAGNYLREVVVPTVRELDASGSAKFYLPTLENGTNRYMSQSITLSGNNLQKITRSGIDQVKITASFPNANLGYDSTFFKFDHLTETKTLTAGSTVEIYVGDVTVVIGQV